MGSLLELQYNWPQNPIPILKAPHYSQDALGAAEDSLGAEEDDGSV